MPVRDRFRILAPSIIVGSCLMVAPAAAGNCPDGGCKPAVKATAPQKPLRLKKFRHQPVALGTPTRVIKTRKGRYARVKLMRHRAKHRLAAAPQPKPPQFLPVVVSPEAAAALAMQASVAQAVAQVRVVDTDDFNEIDRAADTPLVPVRVTTSAEPPAPPASVSQTNAADRGDTIPRAAPAPTAPAMVAADRIATVAPPATVAAKLESMAFELRAWFSRLGAWFGDAWAAWVAAVHSLFG